MLTSEKKYRLPIIIGIIAAVVAVIVATLVAISANSPSRRLADKIALGNQYLSELNYEQAVAAFTEALAIEPQNETAMNGLVASYLAWAEAEENDGNPERAVEILEEGLEATGSDEIISYIEEIADEMESPEESAETDEPAMENEEPEGEAAISVTIRETDIPADSVFNTGGYGSLRINGEYGDDYESTLIRMPQAALIDRSANYLFPYIETQMRYYYSEGVVSKVGRTHSIHLFPDGSEESVGFYDISGKPLFEKNYDASTPMIDGYAVGVRWNRVPEATVDMEKIDTVSIYDKNGIVVYTFPAKFYDIWGIGGIDTQYFADTRSHFSRPSDGLILCWDYSEDYYPEVIYYVDLNGDIQITLPSAQYSNAGGFQEGLANVVNIDGKCGYINKSGELEIPCNYDDAMPFCDNLAAVCLGEKWGYIDANGEVVIPFEYDAAFGAGGGLAAVGKDGKYGLVDYENHVVVPLEFDDISSFEERVAYAIRDGKVFLITEE